jgi:hypothetical protein
MERKVPEFEKYLAVLHAELTVGDDVKEDICREMRQSLYDKYNELLTKGYGFDLSIPMILEDFEDPEELAEAFNHVHEEGLELNKFIRLAFDRRIILAAVIASFLMTFIR